MKLNNKLVVFQDKKIRRIWFNDEWWFSVVDVVHALTDSSDPKQYIKKLKSRDFILNSNWGTICTPLKMPALDGKIRKINAANTENIFRIIQSIPSKKAEPFKRWLAKVGYERVQEIENPELAQERMLKLYKAKGYSDSWIYKRLRGIAVRQDLTNEWKQRGVEQKKDFAILTAEISKATFGMTPSEYKKYKNLSKKSKVNLRDHMNDLELIFTMLGEKVTTEITRKEDKQKFNGCSDAAKRGGKVAGNARKETEKEIGSSVSTKDNYLEKPEKRKKLK